MGDRGATVSPTRTGPYVFPMQGKYGRPEERISPGYITWDDALEIFRYYHALFGNRQTLSRMGGRGGFSPGEYEYLKQEWQRGREKGRQLPTLDEIRKIAGEHYAPHGVPIIPDGASGGVMMEVAALVTGIGRVERPQGTARAEGNAKSTRAEENK